MRGATANCEAIKAGRVQRGLTQEQLAKLADVDVKTVRKAEQGKRLDLGTLTRLAFALQTELRLLVVPGLSENELHILRRDIVLRWHRAWHRRDADCVLELFHDDGVLRLPGGAILPFSGVYRGKAGVRHATELAWAVSHTTVVPLADFSLLVADDSVILNSKKLLSLRQGGDVNLSVVYLFKFAGALILDLQVEFDTLEFARALELLPPIQQSEDSGHISV